MIFFFLYCLFLMFAVKPSAAKLRGISFTVSAWPLGRLEVLLLAVYHTVISLQNLTTNEHAPSLSGSNICYLKLSFFLCGKIGS